MSITHPDLVQVVEKLSTMRAPQLSAHEEELLYAYACPPGVPLPDQLDRETVEAVTELTGRRRVQTPELASQALLAALS